MLNGIKSGLVFKEIIKSLKKRIYLKIFKYNKMFQHRQNIDIKEYKTFLQIEIELFLDEKAPFRGNKKKFINYIGNKASYHIYFEDNEKEAKRNYIINEDNIKKVTIKIDRDIKYS